MLKTCEVIFVFNTSIGILAAISFENDTPYVGMQLQNSGGYIWEIKGLGVTKRQLMDDDRRSFWDCNLEPVNHDYEIKKGDILFWESREG